MAYDKKFMARAIDLALKGAGAVDPNPMVGAVIVKDNKVIAEGYHHKYGDLHAERDALSKLDYRAEGAEMYVTLEPCCHTGKQPPCTEAIINAGIKKVYIGSSDPNPLVAGKGIKQLQSKGISVVTGMMKDECDSINKVFFHFITHKRPYVVYKYAMTMDGKICTKTGDSKWISGEESRACVHRLRHWLPGIMTGIGTVLKDDPMLNCRMEEEDIVPRNPVRIICDSNLRLPLESNIVKTADKIRTIAAISTKVAGLGSEVVEKMIELEKAGVEIMQVPPDENGHLDPVELLNRIGKRNISGILLEGGGSLAWSMLNANLVNEIYCFIGPKIFGGTLGLTPVEGRGVENVAEAFDFTLKEVSALDGDIMAHYEKGTEN